MFRKSLKPEKQNNLTAVLMAAGCMICVVTAGCASKGSLSAGTASADVEPSQSTSDGPAAPTPLDPFVTTDDLNKRLLANLDKTEDETIRYVFELSPDNLKIDTTWKGSFTGNGKKELLSIIRLKGVPHAGGLDCSVAAVYDADDLSLVSQTAEMESVGKDLGKLHTGKMELSLDEWLPRWR